MLDDVEVSRVRNLRQKETVHAVANVRAYTHKVHFWLLCGADEIAERGESV